MEQITKSLDTAPLLETYRELLQSVKTLPLLISGNSMVPFLVHERDTVYLTRIDRPLKVGDMVLYQRDNGEYILHRICRLEGERFCMVGDAQIVLEHGIRYDQVFARVEWVQRKGKQEKPGSFWWTFFEKVWVRMVPCRPVILRLYGIVRNCYRRN